MMNFAIGEKHRVAVLGEKGSLPSYWAKRTRPRRKRSLRSSMSRVLVKALLLFVDPAASALACYVAERRAK